jgi:hypothetical protein
LSCFATVQNLIFLRLTSTIFLKKSNRIAIALLAIIYISGVIAIREQIYRVGSIMQKVLAQLRQDILPRFRVSQLASSIAVK